MVLNKLLPNAVIVDIDGCLAPITPERLAMLNAKDFDSFNASARHCASNQGLIELTRILFASGVMVILMTGRQLKCYRDTSTWLNLVSAKYDLLYMRPDGDIRSDADLKRNIYEVEVKDQYNVLFVIEDRDKVVAMWRELGLTCLQAGPSLY